MSPDNPAQLPPFAAVEPRPGLADPVRRSSRDFGRLGQIASWLAQRLPADELRRPCAVLVSGDHDGPDDGTNLPGPMGELLSRLAQPSGAAVREVDIATRYATDTALVVRRGHPSGASGPVCDREDILAAVATGRRIADLEIDAGADLLIPGLAGRGHAVPIGVLLVALCTLEPVDAVPLMDVDPAWATAVELVRDTTFRIRDLDRDALTLLAEIGGADFAALAGLIAQAAARRTPVLLDGLPATVAAVLAHRLAPGAESWLLAAGESPSRGGRRLQEMLGLPAVASLDTNSWAGAGGLLVLPLIRAALAG